MSWLVYALCGPVLWAISTHLDKYLVERYFKHADVLVLSVFTALLIGVRRAGASPLPLRGGRRAWRAGEGKAYRGQETSHPGPLPQRERGSALPSWRG